VNGLFDEGVYLSLMQTEARGEASIYKDIVFGHPPGVIWAGAWLWEKVHGSVYALRCIYILFCSLGLIPMYAIARRLYGAKAALMTLFLMVSSPGFANWLGSTIFLELPQNVVLYLALWILVCVPRPRPLLQMSVGALFALSFIIKQPCIPAAMAMTFALFVTAIWPQKTKKWTLAPAEEEGDGQVNRTAWLYFVVAFVVVLIVVVRWLSQIPHYWEYFVYYYSLFKNTNDAAYQWGQHLYELTNGFYALPIPLTFGTLGVWWMWRNGAGRAERCLALYSLTIALMLFIIPRRFYWRYLIISMPVFCLGVAVWWQQFLARPPSRIALHTARVFAVLFGLVHCVSVVLYHTHESRNPEAYTEAIRILQNSPGPVFALDNIWAPVSGQPLTLWKHNGGDVLRRRREMEDNPQQVFVILDRSPTVLINREALYWMTPAVENYIRAHYTTVFRHLSPGERHYVEILRRKPSE
jgi:4-amino-4-deoxy-L-arabinose transferase-like glycosyltransferase